jgi:hypothetical protein
MELCIRLIDKIQNEYYSIEYMDYQISEFEWIPIENGSYELKINILEENFDDYLNKHKASVRKILNNKSLQKFSFDKNDKEKLAMSLSYYNEERVLELLFKILNRHIRSWWD